MRKSRHHVRAPDGTRLAFTSAGEGSPAVLLTDGIGCAGYIWRRLAPGLAATRRVLHWNYRGHGESEPPKDPDRATVDDCVSDLFAVLDAAQEERAVLVGHSMGVQVVLEAQRRAPARVAGLVLLCGAAGRLLDTFHESTVLRSVLPWARKVVDRWPALARAGFRALVTADVAVDYALAFEVNRALLRRDDLLPYFEDLSRVDPALFVRLLASAAEHDATPHLGDVAVPTLVVAGARDAFTPMRLSVKMHELVRGSELLVVPGGTHVAPLEQPELVDARVRDFLAARVPAVPGRRRRTAGARASPSKPRKPSEPRAAGSPPRPRRVKAAAAPRSPRGGGGAR